MIVIIQINTISTECLSDKSFFFFLINLTDFLNDLPNETRMETTISADDVCFILGHKCAKTLEHSVVNDELASGLKPINFP